MVERFKVDFLRSEGFCYGFTTTPVEGEYRTDEVSAGQHSYDLEEFVTRGRKYSADEMFETNEAAEEYGYRVILSYRNRARALLKLFEEGPES